MQPNHPTATSGRFYFAGAQRIAMRTGTDVKFLLGDHLGSTSVTALASGAFDIETRYYPWGEVRWTSGTTPTDYRFTGQQENITIGLYFYNSRFYDAALGRFISPDTIIPLQQQGSQAWDRYAGMNNNPVRYIDPSGHSAVCGVAKEDCDTTWRYSYAPDADLVSINGTIGVGPLFLTASIDVVTTGDEVGIFTVSGVGPWLGGSKVSGVNGSAEEATWVTPQFGASFLEGDLWGDGLARSVKQSYSSTALVGRASIGPLSAEVFTSIDNVYGIPNWEVVGVAYGVSAGAVPYEGHLYYTNAIYNPVLSDIATWLGSILGLLNR